jgi:hypothetical protein
MGLPIFGTSNYTNAQWVPEPNNRGTWGLLQTCLLTLGLCIYSAVHVNILHRECKLWMRLLIRCKWLLVALLAPEFIVFNAWSQRRQAVRLACMLRRRCGQEEPETRLMRWWRWIGPKTRIVDRERGQIQEQRHGGNVSDSRVEMADREGLQSQHIQPDAIESVSQEHNITHNYDDMKKSTEVSVQV